MVLFDHQTTRFQIALDTRCGTGDAIVRQPLTAAAQNIRDILDLTGVKPAPFAFFALVDLQPRCIPFISKHRYFAVGTFGCLIEFTQF